MIVFGFSIMVNLYKWLVFLLGHMQNLEEYETKKGGLNARLFFKYKGDAGSSPA